MREKSVAKRDPDNILPLKLCAGSVGIAVLLVYLNSFHNAYHFDDFHTTTDNPAIRSLKNIPRFFSDATTFSVLSANQTYRPLVSASLALDYALGHGYMPLWFHVSTFVWFMVLLGCLYLLYEAMLRRTEKGDANPYLALMAMAWFGLHPAVAETVNYIIQRGDLYCTLGCVAALVLYERFPAQRRYGLYLLPYAAALLCKPPAAVFPLLLLFYIFLFHAPAGPGRWKRSVAAIIPALAVTGGLMWLQSAMTPKSFAPSILSAWDYRLTQPFVWLRYSAQLFLPLHLNVDSDLQPFKQVDWRVLLGFAFVAAVAIAIWLASRQRRYYPVAYGLIWFVLTQLPTSVYPLSEVENDHRMFFSFAGLVPAVVWAVWLLLGHLFSEERLRHMQPAIVACVVLVLCGYAWGTHLRNRVWQSEDSVWLDDVQKSPHNGRGLMIYGLTLMNKGAYSEALGYFTRALEFTPNYPTLEINIGVVNGAMGRGAEAERHFLRAISLAPGDDLGHAFYGRWLLQQERVAEAITEERAAVALNPQRPLQREVLLSALGQEGDSVALHQAAEETLAAVPGDATAENIVRGGVGPAGAAAEINRSMVQYRRGEYAEAIVSAQHALAIDPKSAAAYNNIGAAYAALGQWDEAIADVTKALQLDPSLQLAKNNLISFTASRHGRQAAPALSENDLINRSVSLNRAGKFTESIAAAQQALRLDQRSAESWNNIAAGYAALKRWDEAVEASQRAIALKPDFQLAKNNLAWAESQKAAAK